MVPAVHYLYSEGWFNSVPLTLFCCAACPGLFLGFGLSGVVPAVHYLYSEGWFNSVPLTAVGYLALMGALYVAGALLYAFRVPERWFPGKCDIYVS